MKFGATAVNAKCLALSLSRGTVNSCVNQLTSRVPDFLKSAFTGAASEDDTSVFRDNLISFVNFQKVFWYQNDSSKCSHNQYLVLGYMNGMIQVWLILEDSSFNTKKLLPDLVRVASLKTVFNFSSPSFIQLVDDLPGTPLGDNNKASRASSHHPTTSTTANTEIANWPQKYFQRLVVCNNGSSSSTLRPNHRLGGTNRTYRKNSSHTGNTLNVYGRALCSDTAEENHKTKNSKQLLQQQCFSSEHESNDSYLYNRSTDASRLHEDNHPSYEINTTTSNRPKKQQSDNNSSLLNRKSNNYNSDATNIFSNASRTKRKNSSNNNFFFPNHVVSKDKKIQDNNCSTRISDGKKASPPTTSPVIPKKHFLLSELENIHILQQPYEIVGLYSSLSIEQGKWIGTLVACTMSQIRIYDTSNFELRFTLSRFDSIVMPGFWQWALGDFRKNSILSDVIPDRFIGPVVAVGSRWLVYQETAFKCSLTNQEKQQQQHRQQHVSYNGMSPYQDLLNLLSSNHNIKDVKKFEANELYKEQYNEAVINNFSRINSRKIGNCKKLDEKTKNATTNNIHSQSNSSFEQKNSLSSSSFDKNRTDSCLEYEDAIKPLSSNDINDDNYDSDYEAESRDEAYSNVQGSDGGRCLCMKLKNTKRHASRSNNTINIPRRAKRKESNNSISSQVESNEYFFSQQSQQNYHCWSGKEKNDSNNNSSSNNKHHYNRDCSSCEASDYEENLRGAGTQISKTSKNLKTSHNNKTKKVCYETSEETFLQTNESNVAVEFNNSNRNKKKKKNKIRKSKNIMMWWLLTNRYLMSKKRIIRSSATTVSGYFESLSKFMSSVPEHYSFKDSDSAYRNNPQQSSKNIFFAPKSIYGTPLHEGGRLVIIDLLNGNEIGTVDLTAQSNDSCYYDHNNEIARNKCCYESRSYTNNTGTSQQEQVVRVSELSSSIYNKSIHCIDIPSDNAWCLTHVDRTLKKTKEDGLLSSKLLYNNTTLGNFDKELNSRSIIKKNYSTRRNSNNSTSNTCFNSTSSSSSRNFLKRQEAEKFQHLMLHQQQPEINESLSHQNNPLVSSLYFDFTGTTLFCIEWTGRSIYVCRFHKTSSGKISGYPCFTLKRGNTAGSIVHLTLCPNVVGHGYVLAISSRGRCHFFSVPSQFHLSLFDQMFLNDSRKQIQQEQQKFLIYPDKLSSVLADYFGPTKQSFGKDNSQYQRGNKAKLETIEKFENRISFREIHVARLSKRGFAFPFSHKKHFQDCGCQHDLTVGKTLEPTGRCSFTAPCNAGLEWRATFFDRAMCSNIDSENKFVWSLLSVSSDGVVEYWDLACNCGKSRFQEREFPLNQTWHTPYRPTFDESVYDSLKTLKKSLSFGERMKLSDNLMFFKPIINTSSPCSVIQRRSLISVRSLPSVSGEELSLGKKKNYVLTLDDEKAKAESEANESRIWSSFCEPATCAVRNQVTFRPRYYYSSDQQINMMTLCTFRRKLWEKPASMNTILRNGDLPMFFIEEKITSKDEEQQQKQQIKNNRSSLLGETAEKGSSQSNVGNTIDAVLHKPLFDRYPVNTSQSSSKVLAASVCNALRKPLHWNTEDYVLFQS